MSLQYELAEVGDRVYYAGKIGHTDNYTMGLMREFLKPGSWYTVKGVYNGNPCKHYEFVETSTGSYIYPYKCFQKLTGKKFIMDKYGLR